MKTLIADSNVIARVLDAEGGAKRGQQRLAPYAAVAWSLIYAGLGFYWAAGGGGFPFAPESPADIMAPLLGRFGPGAARIVVLLAGLPAAALGAAMLRGVRGRVLRPALITFGALLAAALLLMMTSLNLLVKLGYTGFAVASLLTGAEFGRTFLASLTEWALVHQLVCLTGGFLWLAATVVYARRSGDVCEYCGRRDDAQGWTNPESARRWGRIAVFVAMAPPVLYAFTRFAWALGIPLGMSEAYLRRGQESGMWIAGLSIAAFGLACAALMLGLVQRWGEVFPRWMPGLGGRRVPVGLAVVPAALASVPLIVGGVAIWTGLPEIVSNLATYGGEDIGIVEGIVIHAGPTLLFPVWGAALAVATLAYYYRRRGPCKVCGRGEAAAVREMDMGAGR